MYKRLKVHMGFKEVFFFLVMKFDWISTKNYLCLRRKKILSETEVNIWFLFPFTYVYVVQVYEKEIYAAVLGERDEIEAQMDITEKLCKELNTSTKKAWLEMDNLVLDKLQKERNDLKVGQSIDNIGPIL